MAKQIIDIGTSANKGDGDPLRTAFRKINDNFTELYAANGNVDGAATNVSPSTDATFDLGSASKQWADLYVADFIYLNGARIEVTAGGALLVNGGAPAEVQDTVGSVFGDDSTLLVDGVNSLIPSSVIQGSEATNWNTAFGWGDHSTAGYLTSLTGDLTGSVFADDSSLMVDAINNKLYAETLTTLAVFGNPTLALNADVIALDAQNGILSLQTTDTILNSFVNAWEVNGTNGASLVLNDDGIVPSELSINVDTFTVTGDTVLGFPFGETTINGSINVVNNVITNTIQNTGNITIQAGTNLHLNATTTDFTGTVDFSSATFTGEPWISVTDLQTLVAASIDFDDFKTRIAAL